MLGRGSSSTRGSPAPEVMRIGFGPDNARAAWPAALLIALDGIATSFAHTQCTVGDGPCGDDYKCICTTTLTKPGSSS